MLQLMLIFLIILGTFSLVAVYSVSGLIHATIIIAMIVTMVGAIRGNRVNKA